MRHTKHSLLNPLKCCDISTQLLLKDIVLNSTPTQRHCSYFLLSLLELPIKWTGFTKNNHLSSGILFENALTAVIIFIVMNSVIIHTLRTRSIGTNTRSEGQGQGQGPKVKSSEKQIYIMLLLVTFGFMILTTPTYTIIYVVAYWNYQASARGLALFYLLYNVAQKTIYTNYAINFFLYVISGQKFRSDLVGLSKCKQLNSNLNTNISSGPSNVSSNVSVVSAVK